MYPIEFFVFVSEEMDTDGVVSSDWFVVDKHDNA